MTAYDFNRQTYALQQQMIRPNNRPKGPAFEAPAVFKVRARDGTVIPIPLELLADEARIVVTQPEGPGPRVNYAYVVSINNRKGKLVPEFIKKLGLKQLAQKSILKIIGLMSAAGKEAATKPVSGLVGMLYADDLGNDDSYYKSTSGESTDGKRVYFFLTGDHV